MSFVSEVVDGAPPGRLALVELTRDGERRVWRFGELAEASARAAGVLRARGVRRGEVVMTVIGSRSEWVVAMLAGFRLGAVVLSVTEQLRAADLRARLATAATGRRRRRSGKQCMRLWLRSPIRGWIPIDAPGIGPMPRLGPTRTWPRNWSARRAVRRRVAAWLRRRHSWSAPRW